eukprot:COSAG01_NODE_1344_length_10638_cov_4.525856_1_plen_629_part_00
MIACLDHDDEWRRVGSCCGCEDQEDSASCHGPREWEQPAGIRVMSMETELSRLADFLRRDVARSEGHIVTSSSQPTALRARDDRDQSNSQPAAPPQKAHGAGQNMDEDKGLRVVTGSSTATRDGSNASDDMIVSQPPSDTDVPSPMQLTQPDNDYDATQEDSTAMQDAMPAAASPGAVTVMKVAPLPTLPGNGDGTDTTRSAAACDLSSDGAANDTNSMALPHSDCDAAASPMLLTQPHDGLDAAHGLPIEALDAFAPAKAARTDEAVATAVAVREGVARPGSVASLSSGAESTARDGQSTADDDVAPSDLNTDNLIVALHPPNESDLSPPWLPQPDDDYDPTQSQTAAVTYGDPLAAAAGGGDTDATLSGDQCNEAQGAAVEAVLEGDSAHNCGEGDDDAGEDRKRLSCAKTKARCDAALASITETPSAVDTNEDEGATQAGNECGDTTHIQTTGLATAAAAEGTIGCPAPVPPPPPDYRVSSSANPRLDRMLHRHQELDLSSPPRPPPPACPPPPLRASLADTPRCSKEQPARKLDVENDISACQGSTNAPYSEVRIKILPMSCCLSQTYCFSCEQNSLGQEVKQPLKSAFRARVRKRVLSSGAVVAAPVQLLCSRVHVTSSYYCQ